MSTISTERTELPTGTWKLDQVHSSIGFSVKHVVVRFRGGFDRFDVTLDEQGLRGTTDVSSIDIDEPKVDLVDECGRLKGVPRCLASQTAARHPAQFVVDERDQPVQRFGISLTPGQEQVRYIMHAERWMIRS